MARPKPANRFFLVVVTYGTRPNSIYASIPSNHPGAIREAETLCKLAKSLGYSDARIVNSNEPRFAVMGEAKVA